MILSPRAPIAALSFVALASAAFAHAHLQTAVPAVDGTVAAAPTAITINFTEGVEPAFSGISLTASDGSAVPVEKATVDPQNKAVMVVKIDKALTPGTYKVDWHAVAVDTHHTEGSFSFTIAAAGSALEFKAGDIVVDEPWSRATPKGAPVAGGYMVIRNDGATEDRLTGGTFADAGKVEVHEMSMENGIMKMRELPNGLAIPPGGSVTLDPNGDHLMLMDLKRQLTPGDVVEGELDFARAGKLAVEYRVGGIGDKKPPGDNSADKAMPGPMGGAMKSDDGMSMPMH